MYGELQTTRQNKVSHRAAGLRAGKVKTNIVESNQQVKTAIKAGDCFPVLFSARVIVGGAGPPGPSAPEGNTSGTAGRVALD